MLAERYRVIGLLGRGGMGEVYRADDLKLAQPVALKFLPEAVEQDPNRLARFLNEVRVALQVSHPNVCRVHDIGEVDGQHYISMEYVDGEDLASLLRRIGRFPEDRAIQAARQLCAGLAAAHDKGILHRDLKPANIMIDGRGRVKVTDFGLASLAADLHGAEAREGTPAYMAPEQLAGQEVTQRSDIYALGLVLYELFTGKPALEGRTPVEIARRQDTTPASPSSIVEGLEPAVERVILRCLEKEPGDRPGSALAVAAALPGGDPLAAALAAGETPSPELVAEAGAAGGLNPSIAVPCLAAFLIAAGLLVSLSGKGVLVRRVTLDTPPEVLAAKAREVIRDAGYEGPPADSVYTFYQNGSYIQHLRDLEPAPGRWDVLRNSQPAGVRFGYRQSPRLLVGHAGPIGGWLGNPPPTFPGMVQVHLDTEGRLVSFSAVPPQKEEPSEAPAGEPVWAPLFAAAGFDRQAFTPIEPVWLPPVYADRRAAWEGVYPEAPDTSIRVEAAAYRNRPVAFHIIEPWTRAVGTAAPKQSFWARARDVLNTVWFVVVLVGAGLVALRNIRLGRGDRKTALRFALYLGGVRMLWLLGAHHIPSSAEINLFTAHIAWALYRVGLVYVFYLALEPYARRLWPHMLVSWVRLMGGRFRDPLVGRDLLIGALYGASFAVIIRVVGWIPEVVGIQGYGFEAGLWSWESLRGLRQAVAAVAGVHTQSLLFIFIGIMMFLLLRLLLRRTWIAVVLFSMLGIVLFNPGTGHPAPHLLGNLFMLSLFWFVLFRFGLLPIILGSTVCDLLILLPLTFDLTAWYGHVTLLVLFVTVGIAVWGFWTALAGRPLFRDEILEANAGAG
jgi:serine/threonine-protein kinase